MSSHSLHETSSVFVDSAGRAEVAVLQGVPPKFTSDASKVVAKGLGLSKGFVGQKNSFTVDCSKAGGRWGVVGVGVCGAWLGGAWEGSSFGPLPAQLRLFLLRRSDQPPRTSPAPGQSR